MDKTMSSFLLFLTVCAITYAQTTKLNPRIYYMHIKSDIKFRFATTLITSKVLNSDKSPVEAHFEVTLPDAAFITEFVMEIDGRLYPGEINEKAKAKKKYETAKKKGQSAGHVAQKPRHTNRFSVDINVAAESKVTFNLTYQELLERVYEEYEHVIYIDPGQIVEDFQIDVSIEESNEITKVSVPPLRNDLITDQNLDEGKNALAVIDRPTLKTATIHYAPTADDQRKASQQGLSGLFVVKYDVERDLNAGEVLVVDGYFVHFFAPEGMDPVPKDVLFILDVSSSMSGNKIRQQRSAIDRILQDLHEGDRFNIMEFSTNAKLWKNQLIAATSKNKADARKYAKRMSATGWTDINTAMLTGLRFLNAAQGSENRMQIIVFLTDGQASKGVQDNNQILKNIDDKNSKGTAVFSLAFGNDADYEFVKKVAVKNKGVARKIFEDSDASLQIKGFYDEISAAALRNVSFKYLENNIDVSENATRMSFDTYFNGKELVVAGKLSTNDVEVINLIVTGDGSEGHVELELESDIKSRVPELTKTGDYEKITERIWAYLTIKQLLETAIGESDAERKRELNDKALQLSLKYKFVTPLTSMVVTKPDERDLGSFDENEDAELALADPLLTANAQNAQFGQSGTQYAQISSGIRGGGGGGGGNSRGGRGNLGGGGGGYSRGGGGGGDPHFMLRINGIEFPVCFDVDAEEGDILNLLSDPNADVTITAEIVKSTQKNHLGKYKTFIGKLLIMTSNAKIVVTPDRFTFNGGELSWNQENVFEMLGVKLHASSTGNHDRLLKIDFGNDVSVVIRRLMKDDTNREISYLNIYIDKERGLSNKAGGILGEFVHKKTVLFKTSLDSKGRHRGHFRESENHNKTHFTALLHQKPDVISGQMVPCWNLHKKTDALLNKNVKDYILTDITKT